MTGREANGTRIVSVSSDNTVRMWGAATGQPLGEPLLWHTAWVNSPSFLPDSIHIVSGSDDQTVWLWDAATGQPVGVPLREHTGAVTSVSFSPDGTRITSGSYDKTLRLWDAALGQPVGEPLQGHTAWVNSVSFSPNGTHIMSGSSDNTVQLWEAATGKPIDGTHIVSSSVDDTIRLWYAAAILQPLQECPKQDYLSSSSDSSRTKHATNDIMSTNTWNNHSICFSLNSNHALCNPAELMEGASHHDGIWTSFSLRADG
ncbi:WD40 repeat-like protein [Suillus weaverae]|nr:WD40 repeat-like protein [Suillus weaverae]